MIADPDKRLYDQYNVFEADGAVQMLAGDALYNAFVAKHVRKLLDTDFVNTIASALDNTPAEDDGPRQLQMSAFIALDETLTVTWSHYCKTIADFPTPKELLQNL